MLLAVRSSDARHWWTEQFKDDATKVVLKIKNVALLVEGDAPIANSLADHISTPYVPVQPKGAEKPQRPKPVAPWKQPQTPGPEAAAKKRSADISGKHKICHGFTSGKCKDTKAGPCGPNSCANKPVFIHACIWCGEVGHNGKSTPCPTRPAQTPNDSRKRSGHGAAGNRGGRIDR